MIRKPTKEEKKKFGNLLTFDMSQLESSKKLIDELITLKKDLFEKELNKKYGGRKNGILSKMWFRNWFTRTS